MTILSETKAFFIEKNLPQEIGEGVCFLAYGGSYLHGTNDENSDIDLRATLILTPSYELGIEKFEHKKIVSGEKGINYSNDLDVEIFHYATLIRKAMNGEIPAIETLFAPEEKIIHFDPLLAPLFEPKELFISKKILFNYLSMIRNHKRAAFSIEGNFKNLLKIERIQKFGYDTKDFMKSVLFMRICSELIRDKKLNLMRSDFNELMAYKSGKISNYNDAKFMLESMYKELECQIENCDIPEKPDSKLINELLINYRKDLYTKTGVFS